VVHRRVLTLSHLYPDASHPGRGPFVRDQVRELAKRHTLAVVAPVPRRPPIVRHARGVVLATEEGVRIVRPQLPSFPVAGRFLEPWYWATRLPSLLRRVYEEIDGELVHAHFAIPDGYAAARFTARDTAPLVLTVWGSDILVHGQLRYTRGLLKKTLAAASVVIAASDQLAERAADIGVRRERLRVIPGGVPYAERESQAEARAALGLSAEGLYFLWVGGFVGVKQPLDAVRAFEEFARRKKQAAAGLAMLGDGPLLPVVRRYVHERGLEGRVTLPGHRPRGEVWRWQCAADLLLNSSRSEGTPVAVLEALGAGTSIAAYPLPGVRGAVDAVNGGALATDSTPQALAEAIDATLSGQSNRNVLSTNARECFSIERTARLIEDVYEAVA
jgi:glycosyltransferase involved in cell wall biosynthesis